MQDSLAVNPYTRWFEIILEYTRRDFTKYSDTLPALGGVARAFAAITKDRYCAGMWESELLQSLCWFREARLLNKKPSRLFSPLYMDFSKPDAYRAPSWSWASINGGRVKMYNTAIDGSTPLINIATPLKVHLEPVEGGDSYGQLKYGYVSIKGSLFPIGDLSANYWRNISPSWEEYISMSKNIQAPGAPPESCPNPALHAHTISLLNKGGNETFEYEQQHIPHPSQKFAIFVLAITEGISDQNLGNKEEAFAGTAQLLVLETTGSKDEYRRIGRMMLDRPSMISIAPEVSRTETRKWRTFEDEDWKRFETATGRSEMVAAKAWVEIAKDSPKRTTIRII